MRAFFAAEPEEAQALREALGAGVALEAPFPLHLGPVSYTHLTLPTTPYV